MSVLILCGILHVDNVAYSENNKLPSRKSRGFWICPWSDWIWEMFLVRVKAAICYSITKQVILLAKKGNYADAFLFCFWKLFVGVIGPLQD